MCSDTATANNTDEPPAKSRKRNKKGDDVSQIENLRVDIQKNQDKKFELIQKLLQKSPEKNDLELFFISLYKTVSKFSPKDQALVKYKVHQIVSEKEMSYFDTSNENDLLDSISHML